jgi:radical SAM family RiPP maturation amino acid epimerase
MQTADEQSFEAQAWATVAPFGPDICPMFALPDSADLEYRQDVARTKRFLECWSLDGEFRRKLGVDAVAAVAEAGLEADPEALRSVWDLAYLAELKRNSEAGQPPPPEATAVRRHKAFVAEKLAFRDRMRSLGDNGNETLRRWRIQQMHRAVLELGPKKAEGLVHATAAFELQKGCSVGCWFCGVGAEKFSAAWPYTTENAALWRDTIAVCKDLIGDVVRHAFCYWASDPLDNPDYEQFIDDFRAGFGRYPQTTTALAARDFARTRRLLDKVLADPGEIQRFSILNLKMLHDVYAAFTPLELLNVEMLPLNKESGVIKANAGRARKKSPAGHVKAPEDEPSTIACVSGFLFNMLEQSVRLVSPCHASERWPNGYWVLEQGTFHDGDSLRALMLGMIERQMRVTVDLDRVIAFNPAITWEAGEDGFVARSRWVKRRFTAQPGLERLGAMVQDGTHTAGDIALAVEAADGLPMVDCFHLLNEMLRIGALDCEPKADLPSLAAE